MLGTEDFDLGLIRPQGSVMAVSWAALADTDTGMTAGMRLMRSSSIEEALAAAPLIVAPSHVPTLADQTDVAMVLAGAIPRRDPAHQSRGRMPTYGYLAQNRWQGVKPFSENPVWLSPSGGIVRNTNNKLLDAPFPDKLSFHWGGSQPLERWGFLMQRREIHTRESFIEAQIDTLSNAARTLLPLVARNLWFQGEATTDGTPERVRQEALTVLADWNGEMSGHRPEPLIYAAWMQSLQERLIQDDVGPLAKAFASVEPLFIKRVFRDVGGASAWRDMKPSEAVEICDEMARLALDDALLRLGVQDQGTLAGLRWGMPMKRRRTLLPWEQACSCRGSPTSARALPLATTR